MPEIEAWTWFEERDDVAVAFFGRQAASSPVDLEPLLSPSPDAVSWLHQVHSNRVRQAVPGLAGEGDALVSGSPRLALVVATADCVPVLLTSPDRIAAVHAGWRGLVGGVLAEALEALGSTGARIEAWIGPSIGPCCYEVGDDVAERLRVAAHDGVLSTGPSGQPHADLRAIAHHQLRVGGILRIRQIDLCTRCEHGLLESYRRDGETAGRNWSVIWRR